MIPDILSQYDQLFSYPISPYACLYGYLPVYVSV